MFTNKMMKAFKAELAANGITDNKLEALMALADRSWIEKSAAEWLTHVNGEATNAPMQTTESHEKAQAIMGRNFLGLEEVEKAFGVKYSTGDRAKLATIQFSDETLCASKDTHVLVAGFRMSINDIRKNRNVKGNAAKLFFSAVGEGWYNDEPFANASVECRWFLLRKKPIDNSTSKTYEEQLQLIPRGEENPWARDVVFATIALFLTTGERMFEKIYVRCKDVSSRGGRFGVGFFVRDGLDVYFGWDGCRDGGIGVGSVRNS